MKIHAEHLNRPCVGETLSGDAALVRGDDGVSLLAVIDALGHGPKAADVASRAAKHLAETPLDEEVLGTMQRLHEALRGTRGAAAMLLILRHGWIEGCGVGNVELRGLNVNLPVVQSPGILGVRVRRYNVFSGHIAPGARLMLFSDGISPRVAITKTRAMSPRAACEYVFDEFRRPHDDATVLVVDVQE